jgi:molybdenum cofactor guanylyltransferase
MTGAILCGGQSSRMGTDKGMLKLQTSTWAQTAVDKISSLGIPVVLSVNDKQYGDYAQLFPTSQLIKDDKALAIKGPVCGVLSIHLQYPTEDLFVLACDMPLLDPLLLKELHSHAASNPSYDAYVYTNDKEPEPLCGIYRAKGLAHILELYQNKQLFKHSMKYLLEHVITSLTPLPAEQKDSFRNFNAHAELNGL